MSFLKKGFVMLGGTGLLSAIGAIQGIIIARLLGPEGTGQVQLLFTLAISMVAVFVMGLNYANIYFINHHKSDSSTILINSLYFSLALGLIAFACMIAAFTFGQKYIGHFRGTVALVYSATVALMLLHLLARQILMAQMKVVRYNIVMISDKVIYIALLILLLFAGRVSVEMAAVAFSVSKVFGLLILLFFLREYLRKITLPDMGLLWRTLKHGFKFHLYSVMYALNQSISLLMLSMMMPGRFEALGYYSRATAICSIIGLAPNALFPLLFSHWSSFEGERKVRQTEKVVRVYFVFGIMLIIALNLFGGQLLTLLYGKAFLPAKETLEILSVQQAFWIISNALYALFSATGKPMVSAYSLSATNAINFAAFVLLVPRAGILGAAYSITIAHGICLAINLYVAKRQMGLDLKNCFTPRLSDILR